MPYRFDCERRQTGAFHTTAKLCWRAAERVEAVILLMKACSGIETFGVLQRNYSLTPYLLPLRVHVAQPAGLRTEVCCQTFQWVPHEP